MQDSSTAARNPACTSGVTVHPQWVGLQLRGGTRSRRRWGRVDSKPLHKQPPGGLVPALFTSLVILEMLLRCSFGCSPSPVLLCCTRSSKRG